MNESQQNDILFETIASESESETRETYGPLSLSGVSRLQPLSVDKLKDQIEATATSMLSACESLDGVESSWQLNSVKITLGVSMQGKIFVASGDVKGGIELQFSRK